MDIKKPRGTKDVYSGEVTKWQYIEKTARELCDKFNYTEMRFPTFEYTELFKRGVGDTTDVVQKEMYTFEDRDNRSITLRPEGTASTVRAFLENGLYGGNMPAKYYYIIPCFRYEKPQAGRLREFHQFGVEIFGASKPQADAEVISLAYEMLNKLGLKNIMLNINSIGCKNCRNDYHIALKKYFSSFAGDLCDTCLDRLEKNPMRIIDCKSPVCSAIAKDAPSILDYICKECFDHFEGVKADLLAMGIDFSIDPRIVRGLDYYTKTVFEFVSNEIGAQGTVCGGGRYDGLIEELGGNPMPGLGFAMGIERLILLMDAQNAGYPQKEKCKLYIAPLGEEETKKAGVIVFELRKKGLSAELDLVGRSLKAQMKYADKISCEYSMVIGSNELETGRAVLKNMDTGESCEVGLDNIFDAVTNGSI